ncbi:MAG: hypothetical protein KatS3mg105_0567 [Gemmatales bacterium]|nr:MAG: hypothetical protein KatS3mg105_0567 [Gemmatales bacterium]
MHYASSRACTLALAAVLAAMPNLDADDKSDKGVKVDTVKFQGLIDVVKKNKGKVVVIDFWSTT